MGPRAVWRVKVMCLLVDKTLWHYQKTLLNLTTIMVSFVQCFYNLVEEQKWVVVIKMTK